MAERASSIPYNGAPTVEAGGGGGTMFGVRASPNDMGAQVGGAMQDLGKEFARFDGMINETVANTAEIDYMRASGELTSAYQSQKGLAAQAAFPKYQKDLLELRQKLTKDMPVKASNAFNSVVQRQEISLLNSGREYGLKQVQAANVDSNNALSQLAITQSADPSVAADDKAFGEKMGTIRYAVDAMMDAQGYSAHASRDGDGNLIFNDTPDGRKGKAVYQAELEQRTAMAWENRLKTVANTNVMIAYKMLQDNRKDIPGPVQVQMDAWFQPKVKDYTTRIIADEAQTELDNGYRENVLTPISPVDTILKNEIAADGNISVHSDGDGQAIGGINSQAYPAQFNEAKAILEKDGQEAARKYISDFYDKEVVQGRGIAALPKNVQTIVADGVANHWSGFQKELLDAAKSGATPEQLIDMRRKEYMRLAATDPEKYGKNLEGWNNRLDRLEKSQGIATDGIIPSRADYYRKNYDAMIEKTRKQAEASHPDDPSYADTAVARTKQRLDGVIEASNKEMKANTNLLIKAVTGRLGDKKLPTSPEELEAISPEIKKIWEWTQENNIEGAKRIDGMLTSNAKGGGAGNKKGGAKFSEFWNKILDNPDDAKIPNEMLRAVGNNELTHEGLTQLQKLYDKDDIAKDPLVKVGMDFMIGKMGGKEASAQDVSNMKFDFIKAVKDGLAKDIPLTKLTDPKSPDFAGITSKNLIPDSNKIARDILFAKPAEGVSYGLPLPLTDMKLPLAFGMFNKPPEKFDFNKRFDEQFSKGVINPDNGHSLLVDAYNARLITAQQAMEIGKKYKLEKKPFVMYNPKEASAVTQPSMDIPTEVDE